MIFFKGFKLVFFLMTSFFILSFSVYADELDVTMEIVTDSDAVNITENVVKEIKIPKEIMRLNSDDYSLREKETIHMQSTEESNLSADHKHIIEDEVKSIHQESMEEQKNIEIMMNLNQEIRESTDATVEATIQTQNDLHTESTGNTMHKN